MLTKQKKKKRQTKKNWRKYIRDEIKKKQIQIKKKCMYVVKPVCILMCLFKFEESVNDCLQYLQTNGRSPIFCILYFYFIFFFFCFGFCFCL